MRLSDRLKATVGVNGSAPSPIRLPMSRNDLPTLVRELGFTRGAEIGVWKGEYSAKFCERNPHMHMLCVDPWQCYPAWKDTKNELPPEQAKALMTEAYRLAHARLAPLNCSLIRKFSVDAAKDVKDGSLDFVFVDGNHVYDAVLEDLAAWMPKVKPGGFLAGHDFRVFTNKPTIQVIPAVEHFTATRQIHPWFVLEGDRTPSFLWEVQ
jgi:methyltransferase family protein